MYFLIKPLWGRKLAAMEKGKNLDSLITETESACERIKEINVYIDRLKNKIKVVQGDPNLAYYEYTYSEFEHEKYKIASNLQGAFKEIKRYHEQLQGNYERLQKSIEIQEIMNRYCTRALKNKPDHNLPKKRSEAGKKRNDAQKMLDEKEEMALKMKQIAPIVDTLMLLLSEIDKKHQTQNAKSAH